MNLDRLKGCGVATITPFRNGKIDEEALSAVVQYQVESGVDYLVCLGTTAETPTLSEEEERRVIQIMLEVNDGKVPMVLGNFGGNNTAALIDKFSRFKFDGIDAILAVSPYYNKPSQEGIYQHYSALADVSPLPIIMYNVPGRTSSYMSAETILRAGEHANICGVKDASGDMVQATRINKSIGDDFLLLSGDDPTALPFMSCGGHGVISVIANAYPKSFTEMIRRARADDYVGALAIHERLIDLHHWLYLEGNPAGIKGCMELKRLCRRETRLPIMPLTDGTMTHLMKEVNAIDPVFVA